MLRSERVGSPGPGGVGDGLPALPDGEPVLHRWFVLAMVGLVVVGLGVIVWALTAVRGTDIPPAARRPPGDDEVTHDRGDAALGSDTTAEAGPSCAAKIDVVGDASARATARRALGAVCQLLQDDDFAVASEGLDRWVEQDGALRFAVFELTGVDDSARVDDERLVIELNAKFQFEDGARAAPAVVHELVHAAQPWPVTAADELRAVELTDLACDQLVLGDEPPRVCRDARELLEQDDPLGALVGAGFPVGPEGEESE